MARLPWENEIQELRPPDDVADITGHKGLYGFLSPEMLSRNDPVQKVLSMLEFRKLQVSLSVRNLPDGYIYL